MSVRKVEHLRGLDLFDPDAEYAKIPIHIIGVGGIGSFVAIALAKLGMRDLTVWDGDDVETHNIDNQFHAPDFIGEKKVDAIKDLIEVYLESGSVKTEAWMWTPEDELSGIVISGVDNMDTRQKLWEAVKSNPDVPLYIDGRIGGETVRVLAIRPVNDAFNYEWYENTLFTDEESSDLPCTGKAIIDVGFIVASLITNLVRKFLKDNKVIHDIIMSMEDLTLMKPTTKLKKGE